jgi:outer membrane protein assembly factor BamB
MAINAVTGKQLWAKATRIAPLTLAADSGRAYFHDGERLHAIDRTTGDVAWSSEPVSRRQAVTFNFGPRLVLHEDVLLFAGGDGKVTGFESATGKELWTSEHPNSGYQSPQDLMVIDGLVWFAGTTQGNQDGVFKGRDPHTGEVKKEFPPDINTYWFHHRCYIAKATDNFIIPSRTGIEFVDIDAEHWDINHWVRGGCLYGVMPCNGMVYAPPHDCACYPEAKLFGINALAPAAPTRPVPREVPDAGRLEQGHAWGAGLTAVSEEQADEEWPTYRHDTERSGYRAKPLPSDVREAWSVQLSGRLTPPVIAGGRTYVSQVDAHTLHAFDAQSGETDWTFTAGGRIDSPPTVNQGRVVFGCADGWVYCLRETDGALVWRFRAAPEDRRHMAYEQLESVWPVHGSVLVRENTVYCVAGRSIFLDGGLRMLRLDLATGKKLSETLLDDRNPETGNDLQEVLQTLQMPVGLPDILSSDGQFVYMRSQKFDFEGNRLDIGPHSGNAVEQGGTQRGEGVHLFAPMGFLDESWFHRSYWVWGRSFAGGHNGYYQAGRFTPSGQILVTGAGYVYGYGRKPQYLKWTTTLEHQLFAAGTDPPTVELQQQANPGGATGGSQIGFDKSASLNPANKPLTVEAWINANRPAGVIVARGGPAEGFALTLQQGRPQFLVRSESKLGTVEGPRRIVGEWHHVAGVLTEDKQMRLYVDGELVASGTAPGLVTKDPAQPMEIGADNGSAVGEYQSPQGFTGLIDDVRLYMTALDDAAIKGRFDNPSGAAEAEPVLWVDFDEADARDRSKYRNNGTIVGAEPFDGRFGRAMRFTGGGARRGGGNAGQAGNSFVEHKWAQDVPIYVRAMVLADRTLYLVGPQDMIDEEETFKRITEGDETVKPLLAEQDAALDGAQGSQLVVVDADTGETKGQLALPSVPVWDGLAAAHERLYLTTADGRLVCLGAK